MISNYLGRCALNSSLRVAAAFAMFAAAVAAPSALAAVVGSGDISPNITIEDEDGNMIEVPDLPLFGGPVPGGALVVGGTGSNFGGTATGSLVIGNPSNTDPLTGTTGVIGRLPEGLGLVQIAGLNSEWRMSSTLIVGDQGQGFLELATGARVQTSRNADGSSSGGNVTDFILGNMAGSQGFVTLSGFGTLIVNNNAAIGHQSFGSIEVLDRARLETRFGAKLGGDEEFPNDNDDNTGEGYVLVDGRGSSWNVGFIPTPGAETPEMDLVIGEIGRGTVEIRNQGRVRVGNDTVFGEDANSFGEAIVTGRNSLLWSFEDMIIGNAAGTSGGRLLIADNGLVRVDGDTTIGPGGFLDLAGGTIVSTPAEGGDMLDNDGVIRGDGRIDSLNFINDGDIRNGASVSNLRERLLITGPVTNNDNIESIGGEIEFQELLTNQGAQAEIIGIDAILRFNGGLQNNGGRLFLENTLIYTLAPAGLTSNGEMILQEGPHSTLSGNLTLAGGNDLAVTLGGEDFSRLEVTGNAMIDGDVFVGLDDDYLPQIGDAFEIIDTNGGDPFGMGAGNLTGMFDGVFGGGGGPGFWQASYTTRSAILSYVPDVPVVVFAADFDGNGMVDAGDLAIFNMNFGLIPATRADGDANGDGLVSGADFLIWQQQNGLPVVPVEVPAGGAVPEPSALALAGLALAGLATARRR